MKREDVDIELRGNELRITDRKSTRLNSSHSQISYAVFCLKKKTAHIHHRATAELRAARRHHGPHRGQVDVAVKREFEHRVGEVPQQHARGLWLARPACLEL